MGIGGGSVKNKGSLVGDLHLSGDSSDGFMWNVSVHVGKPEKAEWYRYKMKWYLFTQSATIRVDQSDLNKFWCRYFVDAEKDVDRMSDNEIRKFFQLDLQNADPSFKRWYHAIRRSLV